MKILEWCIINISYKCLSVLYYNWWPIDHVLKPNRVFLH